MNILVLDVGTSGMRGALMDENAGLLWKKQVSYAPSYEENGKVTQAPSDWKNALFQICADCAGEYPVHALAVTSQRSSLIPLDAEGIPVSDAVMWQDTRNTEVCEALRTQDAFVRSRCGAAVNTVFSGGKMTWLRETEPDLYQHTRRLVVIPDYLIHEMTGEYVTDHTYGSRSLLMDIRKRSWSPELLDLFRVEEEKLCRLIAPSSAAGLIWEQFEKQTGIKSGTPVISCGGDQQCAALGQGITGSGKVSVNLGTGAYLTASCDRVPEVIPEGLICNASAIPAQYVLEANVLTCGAALDWLVHTPDYSVVAEAFRHSPPGAGGVLTLPYFQGRSMPDWNSSARAVFSGISLENSYHDIVRSLVEGIAVEVCRSLQEIEKIQPAAAVYLSGGLGRTEEIRQLIADVSGKKVWYGGEESAAIRGAWISAAICLHIQKSWDAAWQISCPEDMRVYTPDYALTAFYRNRSAEMETLYRRIYTETAQKM
ncbi:MAG: hypothetical protein J6M46_08970 [Lachnospiraceae bacterium]|nr:hypothetical protein [Lachnospiraceae bacterium]